MQTRLHAIVMVAMVLLVLLLNIEVSLASGLPGDTVIQFSDTNFEAAVREVIDKPKGDITVNDVAEVTHLFIIGLNIVDLTGIEYFTALEVLSCRENQLTELDVSLNTMLIVLECDMNLLSTLDVSLNPKLESLTCGDNQLTMLDVSHNPVLTWLDSYSNQLMTLDVSYNHTLEKLFCDGNYLTMLDLSQNPVLEELICHNNLFSDKSAIIGLDENRLVCFVFDPQNDR